LPDPPQARACECRRASNAAVIFIERDIVTGIKTPKKRVTVHEPGHEKNRATLARGLV
jgi:hypothetical protein